jgi:hypothetical protein
MNPIKFYGSQIDNLNLARQLQGYLVSTDNHENASQWLEASVAGSRAVKFLCGTTATSGDYSTFSIRARSSGTGNTAGGVIAGNFAASANVVDYANLYAVQGYAQPNAFTQSNASNILCGVYSCVQRTVASSGRSWSLWTDDQSNNKASAGHYLHRLSNNSTNSTVYDGIWSIYAGAGCTYLMNFEGVNAPVHAGDATGGTKSYYISVYINGAERKIQCYT